MIGKIHHNKCIFNVVIQMLGGRVFGIAMTGEPYLIDYFFNTPKAIIMLAGISKCLDIPLEDIVKIMCDPKHPDYPRINNFINNKQKTYETPTYDGYCNELTAKYQANFDIIFSMYATKYPGLTIGMSAEMLPADVLQTLIDL